MCHIDCHLPPLFPKTHPHISPTTSPLSLQGLDALHKHGLTLDGQTFLHLLMRHAASEQKRREEAVQNRGAKQVVVAFTGHDVRLVRVCLCARDGYAGVIMDRGFMCEAGGGLRESYGWEDGEQKHSSAKKK